MSHDGRVGLMWACASNHEPIVRLLLSRGASTRHMDCEGDTALSLAQRRGAEPRTVHGSPSAFTQCTAHH